MKNLPDEEKTGFARSPAIDFLEPVHI